MRFLFAILSLWLAASSALAANVEVKGVRLWAAPDSTRVVFDISTGVQHKVFSLHNPERLVIDLDDARLGAAFQAAAIEGGLVRGLRSGKRDDGGLRVVLDLQQAVRPKSFVLQPNHEYGHRLVIDLAQAGSAPAARTTPAPAAPRTVKSAPSGLRDLVIAIDAGHGGEDPGAIGKGKTREKDVVLAIARRLAKLVNAEPGMRAVLIRDGDYFISLRQRIDQARRHKADLFVSIHADAFRDHKVQGSSVYVLSQRGASSEMARWVAARENASDLVGGVRLDDKDDLLTEVLLDLSQTASIEASMEVGAKVLGQFRHLGKVHKPEVQHAAFAVLRSPDIPSILVETAFISNPHEETKLRNAQHQERLARAMLAGMRDYFNHHPPPGTLMAMRGSRQHVVRSGDTLSHIARHYGVQVDSLRASNGLNGDRLIVGRTLTIPEGS
jgi:N-acetylmuramoyl-L-alanine amidase